MTPLMSKDYLKNVLWREDTKIEFFGLNEKPYAWRKEDKLNNDFWVIVMDSKGKVDSGHFSIMQQDSDPSYTSHSSKNV